MKREAFRDDLAAQRVAIFGYDPAARGRDSTSVASYFRYGKSRFPSDPGPSRSWLNYDVLWVDECPEAENIPAVPRVVHVGDSVVMTIDFDKGIPWFGRCTPLSDEVLADLLSDIRSSDIPGIAAMSAKNVQPTPEPVLSIGGEQATAAEFAAALQAIRGKSAPAVKETPRGLMVVREIDHRLGAWNED
jgi:hypothetical protein